MAKQGAGRPKKYQTAEDLSEAVNRYFDAITKKNGEWKKPPSVAGLCLSLEITRQTLLNYAEGEDERLAFVAQSAKLVIEDYLAGQLSGKFANGAKFALGSGFGWNASGRWSEREQVEEKDEDSSGVIEIAAVKEPDDE